MWFSGRLPTSNLMSEKELYIAFRNGENWYLYPHDELIEKLHGSGIALHTRSWNDTGHYTLLLAQVISPFRRSYRAI